jgi:hypothetical protein
LLFFDSVFGGISIARCRAILKNRDSATKSPASDRRDDEICEKARSNKHQEKAKRDFELALWQSVRQAGA